MKRFFLVLGICFSLSLATEAEQDNVLSVQTQVLPSTTVPVAEEAQILITASGNRKISVSSFTVPPVENFQILKQEISPKRENSEGSWETKIAVHFLPVAVGET